MKKLKYLLSFAILLLGICLIGIVLLFSSYKFTNINKIQQHAIESAAIIDSEGLYPSDYVSGTQRDNFTDYLMFQTAAYEKQPDESNLKKAMGCYRLNAKESVSATNVLTFTSQKQFSKLIKLDYARYWHGYLIVLKPLLIFLNYAEIRVVLLLFISLLLFAIVAQMMRFHLKQYIVPFLLALLFLNMQLIYKSLQYSTVIIPTLFFIYLLIKYKDKIVDTKYAFYLLFILGAVINFFDLLTYPIVSLGFILCFYLILSNKEKIGLFFDIFQLSLAWLFGYAGMWLMKWTAASIILKQNVYKEALEAIVFRTSTELGKVKITYGNVLSLNVGQISIIMRLIIFVYIIKKLIELIIVLIQATKKHRLQISWKYIIFVMIALYPFIWYFVLKNHSYIHYFFAYRNLSITVLSLLFLLQYALNTIKNTIKEENT